MSARADRRRQGFTLIEILVALMVFLAGITGLLALLTSALAMHRDGLSLADATGRIPDVAAIVARQIAAGEHLDPATGLWNDVPPVTLADGTVYSVRFVAGLAATPVAELRVARSLKELPRARPVRVPLDLGPPAASVLERTRRGAGD